MGKEKLQRAQDRVFHKVAEPEPVTLDIEVLLHYDLIVEDVLGEGQPLALGQVVVPQIATPSTGQLLHAGTLDALTQETCDVDILQDDSPIDHVGWDVGCHLGQAQSRGGGHEVGPPIACSLLFSDVVNLY